MKKILSGLVWGSLLCAGGVWVWTGINQKKNINSFMESLKNQQLINVRYDSVETSIWTHVSQIKNMSIELQNAKTATNEVSNFLFKSESPFIFSYNLWKNAFIVEFPDKIAYGMSSKDQNNDLFLKQTGNLTIEFQLDSRKWIFGSLDEATPLNIFKLLSLKIKNLNILHKNTSKSLASIENGLIRIKRSLSEDKHSFITDIDLKNYSAATEDLLELTIPPLKGKESHFLWTKEGTSLVGPKNMSLNVETIVDDKELQKLLENKASSLSHALIKINKITANDNIGKSNLTSEIKYYAPNNLDIKLSYDHEFSDLFIPFITERYKTSGLSDILNKNLKNFQPPSSPAINPEDFIKIFPDLSKYGKNNIQADLSLNLDDIKASSGNIEYKIKEFSLRGEYKKDRSYSLDIKSSDMIQLIHSISDFTLKLATLISPLYGPTVELFKKVALDLAPKFIEKSDDSDYKDLLSIKVKDFSDIKIGKYSEKEAENIYYDSFQKIAPPPVVASEPEFATLEDHESQKHSSLESGELDLEGAEPQNSANTTDDPSTAPLT